MSAIKLGAQKAKDQSNLQKIAEAWRGAVIDRGWIIDGESGGNIKSTDFAEQLAGRDNGKSISDMILNDPYVWISPGDKYASRIQKESLCILVDDSVRFADAFMEVNGNFMVSGKYLLSYCIVCRLPGNVPLDTTPLGFTRGLNKNGKWDEKASLYGSKGGYVVFCDGHVAWFDGSKPARFLKWGGSGVTRLIFVKQFLVALGLHVPTIMIEFKQLTGAKMLKPSSVPPVSVDD
ncbi:MAG: hypothetical protein LBR92_03140 [Puniceicoccales bacterium]|jgi:prepilin-type processing-associated H-X9-DG protein|nr:hypothetical protein [Puniceicoccales bacterium]